MHLSFRIRSLLLPPTPHIRHISRPNFLSSQNRRSVLYCPSEETNQSKMPGASRHGDHQAFVFPLFDYLFPGLAPDLAYCSFFFLPLFFGSSGLTVASASSASFTSASASESEPPSSASSSVFLLRLFTGSPVDRS